MGNALQLEVLALLGDRKGVDDLDTGSVWFRERRHTFRYVISFCLDINE